MRKLAFLLTCVVAIAASLLNSAAANETISLANEAPDLGVQQVSMEVADVPADHAKSAKSCEQESCCFSARDPRWTVQADAIFLSRIGAPDVTLIEDFATGAELLNARDFTVHSASKALQRPVSTTTASARRVPVRCLRTMDCMPESIASPSSVRSA